MLLVRGHNEGSLFRRATGQYVAVVTMRDGRRVSRWAKDRDAAKVNLAELLRLRDAGAPTTARIRVGDYLERWVSDDHGWAPATARKHEIAVRVHIVPSLGGLRLRELQVRDIERFLAGRSRTRTVLHLRATLRRALADAERDGLVDRNVAGMARPPAVRDRERTILDAAQARSLLETTRTTRYGPLWTILVTTGLRISEALGLAWSDVDLGGNDETVGSGNRADPGVLVGRPVPRSRGALREDGRAGRDGLVDRVHRPARLGEPDHGFPVHVRPGGGAAITVRLALSREAGEWVRRPPKTAKGRRTIPLTALGVEALRAQREQQRADRGMASVDGLVFTTPTGHPHHATNLLPRLRADLAAAGLPKVGLHDLRHSAATLLYSMGVPLEVIADQLGHSTVRVTQDLYRHRVPELQRAAADRMQEALG